MQKDYGHSSLYSFFSIGDRVKKKHIDKFGNKYKCEGIVLSVNSDFLQIFWDKCNGKYKPYSMDITFSKCSKYEIFRGDEENSATFKVNKYL